VPDAGPEQDDIPGTQLSPAGHAMMGARTADGEGDLHEAVRMQRVVFGVQVVARVGQRTLGEVEDVLTGIHREVVVHPGTIRYEVNFMLEEVHLALLAACADGG
jgi:hypothetical protein